MKSHYSFNKFKHSSKIHARYKMSFTYICSGWFLIQSIKSDGVNCPIQILWMAVNNGNLEKYNYV